MRLQALLFLLGTAFANPLAELQARQNGGPAAQVCLAAVGNCQAAPVSSARASTWCTSLGFGTSTSFITSTSTKRKTARATTTVFTSTLTTTGTTRTSTLTIPVTTTITQTAFSYIESTTATVTLFQTQTFDSCPLYTLDSVNLNSTTTTSVSTTAQAAGTTTTVQAAGTTTTAQAAGTTTTAQAAGTTTIVASTSSAAGTTSSTTSTSSAATTSKAPSKREVQDLSKRQARRFPKPACVNAANPSQTTNACNCIIPSSTATRTNKVRATITSTRTIVHTKRAVSTTTSYPVSTITTNPVETRTVTTTVTFVRNVEATTSTTIEWQVAETPAVFYLLDSAATTAAAADWGVGDPNNSNDTFNDIVFDPTRNSPTVFSFNDWGELQVAGWSSDSDNIPVVGLDQGNGTMLMAAIDGDNTDPAAQCTISVTPDGLCPIECSVGDWTANTEGAQGLWTLLASGNDTFQNYLYSVEDGWQQQQQDKIRSHTEA